MVHLIASRLFQYAESMLAGRSPVRCLACGALLVSEPVYKTFWSLVALLQLVLFVGVVSLRWFECDSTVA